MEEGGRREEKGRKGEGREKEVEDTLKRIKKLKEEGLLRRKEFLENDLERLVADEHKRYESLRRFLRGRGEEQEKRGGEGEGEGGGVRE